MRNLLIKGPIEQGMQLIQLGYHAPKITPMDARQPFKVGAAYAEGGSSSR
jgi:hypothetical protein